MPKKKSSREEMKVNSPSEILLDDAVKKPVVAKPVPKPKSDPVPVMTFDRWFAHTGKPVHWKAGMKAFLTSTKGKKTKARWDALFQSY